MPAAADRFGVRFAFEAPVTAIAFVGETAVFACGDGTLHRVTGGAVAVSPVHGGAILSLAMSDGGVLTGGDDGRMVLTGASGDVRTLAHVARRWIDPVACGEGGAIAFGAGKEAWLVDARGKEIATFAHGSTVGGVAFAPLKGKRLAVAHYGGVSLWWANASAQTPKLLPWKGAHGAVTWSRDEKFVISAMQENALHGWRLSDMADLRMSGYPAKVKSMSWLPKGRYLATSGAESVICWPFLSKDGPMGKAPLELGGGDAIVAAVAAHPREDAVAAGDVTGAVRLHRLPQGSPAQIDDAVGSPVTAMAWSRDGTALAYGRDDGSAVVLTLPL